MATVVETPTSASTKGRILIVDDELVVRDSLGKWFVSEGYTARPVSNAREALEVIQQQEFDIALLDIKMPGMDGMELQSRLREADPDLTVVMMTGYASVDTAVQALKHGAYDYITKPVDPDELSHLVANALEHKRARRELVRLRENLQEVFPSTELIGKSPAIKKVMELIEMVAPTEATVLITGESGTGKEVVARAIHAAGPRRYMPMVTLHCGALTETLLESELFGHEKGAFTGAQYRKKGKFEVADGGTIFLDEISDISLKTQTDLLRVLQEKEIVRVGGNQQIKVDFRLISATNEDLEEMVRDDRFREDLYYRIHVVPIFVPALRERVEDIPVLAEYFASVYCAANSFPVKRIGDDAMQALKRYSWPGNVRELENAIQRLVIMTDGEIIAFKDLPRDIMQAGRDRGRPKALGAGISLDRELEALERRWVNEALEQAKHVKSEAARLLGVDRNRLNYLCRKYNL